MICRIFYLFLLTGQVVGQSYYVSNVTSDLAGARNICVLATPPIRDDGVTINLTSNALLNDSIEAGDKILVGYTETSADFNYIGCAGVNLNTEKTTEKKRLEYKDIGRCYSMCHTKYIGVSNYDCYCLKSLPQDFNLATCDIECDRPKGTLCGKISAMSIYKKETFRGVSPNQDYSTLACLSLQNPESYGWDNCSYNKSCLYRKDPCKKTASTCFVDNGKFDDRKTWKDCLNYPTDLNLSLAMYTREHTHLIKTASEGQFWIAGVRSFQIINMNLSNNEPTRYGFIEYKGGDEIILRFEDSSAVRGPFKVLCMEGIVNDIVTTTDILAEIAPYLYLAIPTLLVFGIGVLVLCILWRNRNEEEDDSKSVAYKKSSTGEKYESITFPNNAYANLQTEQYSVVLEPTKESVLVNSSENSVYNTTQTDKTDKRSENIYNHKEDTVGSYSHTNTLGIKEFRRDRCYHHVDINNERDDEADTYCHANILGVKEFKRNSLYHHIEIKQQSGEDT